MWRSWGWASPGSTEPSHTAPHSHCCANKGSSAPQCSWGTLWGGSGEPHGVQVGVPVGGGHRMAVGSSMGWLWRVPWGSRGAAVGCEDVGCFGEGDPLPPPGIKPGCGHWGCRDIYCIEPPPVWWWGQGLLGGGGRSATYRCWGGTATPPGVLEGHPWVLSNSICGVPGEQCHPRGA